MNKYLTTMWRAGVIVTLALLISGCRLLDTTAVGETKTETQTIELGAADSASVTINMGAGELTVDGGADALMDGSFRYNVDDWQPRVEYNLNGSEGVLLVDHEGTDIPVGGAVINQWRLNLNDNVPINLKVGTGAGETELDLRGLNLTGLQVDVGAGSTTIDLSSALDNDLSAALNGGVGEMTVRLPSDMGVRVSAETGIGGLTNSDLTKDGDFYVNEAYGNSPNTLFVDISSGIGAIQLLMP